MVPIQTGNDRAVYTLRGNSRDLEPAARLCLLAGICVDRPRALPERDATETLADLNDVRIGA